MKHTVLAALFLQAVAINAQTETLPAPEIRTEEGVLERQRIVNPYDEVFGIHEPARWLFKWDAAGFLPSLGINHEEYDFTKGGLRFDLEWKPGTAFSVNASYQLGVNYLFDDPEIGSHSFRIEPRWYFGMRKRVREGRGASNFSGNYLGLEIMQQYRVNKYLSPRPIPNYRGAMARIGVQRRLFRYGFFDISYGIGIRDYFHTEFNRGSRGIFSEARVAAGLALARPGRKLAAQSPAYCEVLQCFREERRMFKIDLYNLFRVFSTDALMGTTHIAMEQKIGYSPLSVELEGRLGGYYSRYEGGSIQKTYKGNYGLRLQTRYYYGQKRRIATGKSGNNLSGAYLAWQADWWQSYTTVKGYLPNTDLVNVTKGRQSQLATGLLLGVQYRLFKRGFIDFNLGGGWGRKFYGDLSSGKKDPVRFQGMGGLRVGLAF